MTDAARKIYVGNIPEDIGPKELQEKFGRFGAITNIWVARQPPGFCFVTFEDPRDAEDAIRETDGTPIRGKIVKAELAHGPRKRRDERDTSAYKRRDSAEPRTRRRSPSYGRNTDESSPRDRNRDREKDRDRSPNMDRGSPYKEKGRRKRRDDSRDEHRRRSRDRRRRSSSGTHSSKDRHRSK
eukprot:Platyproteum_vivax@DN1956_c0_g1_i1.p1